MKRWTVPRDIYYGRGSLEQLSKLEGTRATLVVGGSSMRKTGILDRAMEFLKAGGMEVSLVENVEPDPSVATVLSGAKQMGEFQPDWIVALGGGSPMDAAKVMWAFYEYPDSKFEDLCVPFQFPKLRKKAKFVGIPSTSGTASEVTAFSVITDPDRGIKYPLADFEITPDIAILDPEIADSMPPTLRAHTGLDALTHAVEAYLSTCHNPFSDPLALSAIQTVFEDLPQAYGGDKDAAERMHYAQCIAGMAFSNSLLGIVHSLAHKTGAAFEGGHIPHGLANAIYLPYVIYFNAKEEWAAERYSQIAKAVGCQGEGLELICRLSEKIQDLSRRMGVPTSLKEVGVPEEEFLQKLPKIAANAVADACTGSNPRKVTEKEMEQLLLAIYHGSEVGF